MANFLLCGRKLGIDLELPFLEGNVVNVILAEHEEDDGCFHNQCG
jgi:hypothetical protein